MKKPLALNNVLGDMFDPANLGSGFKRGMILSVAPKHIGRIMQNPGVMELVGSIYFQRDDLIIAVENGILKAEMNMYRHKIKEALNTRVKGEVIRRVVIITKVKKP